MYDSKNDTQKHIEIIQHLVDAVIYNLTKRAEKHDTSKLQYPEKEMYDKFTPLLRKSTYGSKEYKETLIEMGEALQHHYNENTHHPEHFADGINEMSLFDLIEMFCDWQAAQLRHANGDFFESLEINKKRFNMSEQLYDIFINTAYEVYVL